MPGVQEPLLEQAEETASAQVAKVRSEPRVDCSPPNVRASLTDVETLIGLLSFNPTPV